MTEDIEAELRAFELELGSAIDRGRACARRLREVDDDDLRFLMAERLPALGSAIIPELNEVLVDPASSLGARYLAAWVAVEVGDRADSILVLCKEVEAGSKWSLAAAGVLGRHRIAEGVEPIQKALERVDPKDGPAVMGYLAALRDLQGSLSESVRQRLIARGDPWVARTVEDEFPS